MKKATKIISVMLLIVMALASVANVAFALTPGDIKGDANDNSGIQTVGQKIVGVIQTVGIVTSVIVLAILGIKYMIGSAEEKAEYKKIYDSIHSWSSSIICSICISKCSIQTCSRYRKRSSIIKLQNNYNLVTNILKSAFYALFFAIILLFFILYAII